MIVEMNGQKYRVKERRPAKYYRGGEVHFARQPPIVSILVNGMTWQDVTDPDVRRMVLAEVEPEPEPEFESKTPTKKQMLRNDLLIEVLSDGSKEGWCREKDGKLEVDLTRQEVSDKMHVRNKEVWPALSDIQDAMKAIPGEDRILWPGQKVGK